MKKYRLEWAAIYLWTHMDNISHTYSMKYWCSSPYLIQNVVRFIFVSYFGRKVARGHTFNLSLHPSHSPLALFLSFLQSIFSLCVRWAISHPIASRCLLFLLSLLYHFRVVPNHNAHWDAILFSFSIFLFCNLCQNIVQLELFVILVPSHRNACLSEFSSIHILCFGWMWCVCAFLYICFCEKRIGTKTLFDKYQAWLFGEGVHYKYTLDKYTPHFHHSLTMPT